MKDNRKPRALATGEVKEILAIFDHHLQLELPEERIEDEERVITIRYVPVGMLAAICPWNFPIACLLGKFRPLSWLGIALSLSRPYLHHTLH